MHFIDFIRTRWIPLAIFSLPEQPTRSENRDITGAGHDHGLAQQQDADRLLNNCLAGQLSQRPLRHSNQPLEQLVDGVGRLGVPGASVTESQRECGASNYVTVGLNNHGMNIYAQKGDEV